MLRLQIQRQYSLLDALPVRASIVTEPEARPVSAQKRLRVVSLNETGIDLTLHTNTEDVDLAGSLRHFPAFKVGTLQNRKINDTLTQITLRLRRNQEKK